MSVPIRVLIVDDHPMVAEGIQSILESYDDIEVAGCLTNGQEAVDKALELKPDVVLMDLNMPGMGGLSATEILLERIPGMRILILSMHDSPEYISTALSHGAMGYVLKDVPTDEIKEAIDAVMLGNRYLCTGAEGALKPAGGQAREALTGRERGPEMADVLPLLQKRITKTTWPTATTRLKPSLMTSSSSQSCCNKCKMLLRTTCPGTIAFVTSLRL